MAERGTSRRRLPRNMAGSRLVLESEYWTKGPKSSYNAPHFGRRISSIVIAVRNQQVNRPGSYSRRAF
jgi:hypothetical protein